MKDSFYYGSVDKDFSVLSLSLSLSLSLGAWAIIIWNRQNIEFTSYSLLIISCRIRLKYVNLARFPYTSASVLFNFAQLRFNERHKIRDSKMRYVTRAALCKKLNNLDS